MQRYKQTHATQARFVNVVYVAHARILLSVRFRVYAVAFRRASFLPPVEHAIHPERSTSN